MLIVPKSIRNEIIISLHCEWYIGHCGIFKTIQRICDNYWQPFVKDDVTNYTSTYKICLSTRYGGDLVVKCSKKLELPAQELLHDN